MYSSIYNITFIYELCTYVLKALGIVWNIQNRVINIGRERQTDRDTHTRFNTHNFINIATYIYMVF